MSTLFGTITCRRKEKTVPIKNYTTKIEADQSLAEIQFNLVRNGAEKIMVDYDDGMPTGICFAIKTDHGIQGFALPANIPGVRKVFEKQSIKVDDNQVRRTAWRNVRDWVMAQMAFVEAGNVQTDEVFLPYLTNGRQTLYEAYRDGQLLLPGGAENG